MKHYNIIHAPPDRSKHFINIFETPPDGTNKLQTEETKGQATQGNSAWRTGMAGLFALSFVRDSMPTADVCCHICYITVI